MSNGYDPNEPSTAFWIKYFLQKHLILCVQHIPELAASLFGGFARLCLPSKEQISGKTYWSGIVLSAFVGLMVSLWFEGSNIPNTKLLVYVMLSSFFANIVLVEAEKQFRKRIEKVSKGGEDAGK